MKYGYRSPFVNPKIVPDEASMVGSPLRISKAGEGHVHRRGTRRVTWRVLDGLGDFLPQKVDWICDLLQLL